MKRKRYTHKSSVARIWGIRAGKGGDAHDLFLRDGVIALADAGLGNLFKLNATRDFFYAAYRKGHPADTKSGSAGIGGKYFRFAHEVKIGDLIVYPALPDNNLYVGTVSDEYYFDKASPFPHRRCVRWKFIIPKSELSLASRYELGAARTFFEFKKNAEELLARIANNSVTRFRGKVQAK